jgi:hypothetical protein
MCPVCISTVAVAVAGATSTAGLAALLVSRLRGKKRPEKTPIQASNLKGH